MHFYPLRQAAKTQESKRTFILSWPLLTKSSVTKAGSGKMLLQVGAEYIEKLCPLTCSSGITVAMEPPEETWQKLAPRTFPHYSDFIGFVVLQ